MKKQMLFFVPALVLVGLIAWFFPKHAIPSQNPCDDPEYLALKNAIAHANPSEKEALLKSKGPLMRFLEEERDRCLENLSKYTPPSDTQRATASAMHKTQIAQEEKRFPPTPLVAKNYEGPYPTFIVPTVHSDEFLPSPISWRLLWQGKLTVVQVGVIGESGDSRGKSGLLIWKPQSQENDSIEIVSLTDRPLNVTRLDIVTVCKPFIVVAGQLKQNDPKTEIWVYDLSNKSVHSVSRSQVPCWDPTYEKRDPTQLGN